MPKKNQYDTDDILAREENAIKSLAERSLPPNKAIKEYRRCVVLGDLGSGKTTLLKHLALEALDGHFNGEADILPVYISLHAFARSQETDLIAFASSTWNQYYGFPAKESQNYIEKKSEEGKALFTLRWFG